MAKEYQVYLSAGAESDLEAIFDDTLERGYDDRASAPRLPEPARREAFSLTAQPGAQPELSLLGLQRKLGGRRRWVSGFLAGAVGQ